MDSEFWRGRWREGRIAFHEGAPNQLLQQHASVLTGRRRILVPLCGKSEDLAFLAGRGHEVVGVELVPEALEAFFEAHQLTPRRTRRGAFDVFEAGSVTLLAGDFFALTLEDVGAADGMYDRAALVALPPDLRARYTAKLRLLLPAGSPALVITFDYPQDRMEGPPFSVPEAELRRLCPGLELEQLGARAWESSRPVEPKVVGMERCFRLRF